MDTLTPSRKRPASSPLNAEARQPIARVGSISPPRVGNISPPRASRSAPLPLPSQKSLKLGMVIIVVPSILVIWFYNHVIGHKYASSKCYLESVPDCIRSNLRGSKVKIFLKGACPQTPLVGTHIYMCMSVLSHTTVILLPSCSPPPPNSKSCMKPWLYALSKVRLFVIVILCTDAAYRFYWSHNDDLSSKRRGTFDRKSKTKRRHERLVRVSTAWLSD